MLTWGWQPAWRGSARSGGRQAVHALGRLCVCFRCWPAAGCLPHTQAALALPAPAHTGHRGPAVAHGAPRRRRPPHQRLLTQGGRHAALQVLVLQSGVTRACSARRSPPPARWLPLPCPAHPSPGHRHHPAAASHLPRPRPPHPTLPPSAQDWLLGVCAGGSSGWMKATAGLVPIEGVPGVENVNLSSLVEGHFGYLENMDGIIDMLSL